WLMMSLWDALRMNMMISYQELVRTFPNKYHQQKEQNSFHFLIPLDVLCFILAKISPKSSIPAVAGPSGLLMSGNK
ncbi:hypothetical protein OFN40_24120, partial [Escherichia coli]|nr:hypothetical protein [Escherichia coli]